MYYVYIIQSQKDRSIYKGMTENLQKRLGEHNSGSVKSTKLSRPHELIWYCAFPGKKKASKFEEYLKHGSGHAFAKKHLI
ncbi:MAG: endonuclease [Parcubacteria group bacterium SW_4_46_8]|nr:MAG: endonuclease [Parcubacteria group bacterium SW_4_46_8]